MKQENPSIDDSFTPPEPFDRGVSNLDIVCINNDLRDSLALETTITFGSDDVRIELSDGRVLSQIFLTIEGGRCADAIMLRAPQTAGMQ
jgi:hypothetical protein